MSDHCNPWQMTNIHEACSHVSQLLTRLNTAIVSLPCSLPEGASDGPISKYLIDLSVDEDEGPYFSFNQAWECVFQKPEQERAKLVV